MQKACWELLGREYCWFSKRIEHSKPTNNKNINIKQATNQTLATMLFVLQDDLQSGRVAYSLLSSEAGEAPDHI